MQVDKSCNPESIGTVRHKLQSERALDEIQQQQTQAARRLKSTEHGLRITVNPLQDLKIDLYRYIHCYCSQETVVHSIIQEYTGRVFAYHSTWPH